MVLDSLLIYDSNKRELTNSDNNRLLAVFCKKNGKSEIIIVISMKNWSSVQNFGMIVYRESGFVQNGQN